VRHEVYAEAGDALQVYALGILRGGLEQDLKLVVGAEPVRVLAVAPIGRAAGGRREGST